MTDCEPDEGDAAGVLHACHVTVQFTAPSLRHSKATDCWLCCFQGEFATLLKRQHLAERMEFLHNLQVIGVVFRGPPGNSIDRADRNVLADGALKCQQGREDHGIELAASRGCPEESGS